LGTKECNHSKLISFPEFLQQILSRQITFERTTSDLLLTMSRVRRHVPSAADAITNHISNAALQLRLERVYVLSAHVSIMSLSPLFPQSSVAAAFFSILINSVRSETEPQSYLTKNS